MYRFHLVMLAVSVRLESWPHMHYKVCKLFRFSFGAWTNNLMILWVENCNVIYTLTVEMQIYLKLHETWNIELRSQSRKHKPVLGRVGLLNCHAIWNLSTKKVSWLVIIMFLLLNVFFLWQSNLDWARRPVMSTYQANVNAIEPLLLTSILSL